MLQYTARCGEDLTPIDGYPGWFSALLRARGADTEEKARRFLEPGPESFGAPEAYSGVTEAAELLRKAAEAGKRILIYGDYDVDGVCATAILLETLREMGAGADFRIPSRHTEGYGLHAEAVREIAGSYDLLVTVDCGISSAEEAALARSLNLEVIITDHHQPPEKLPEADALVNPLVGGAPFRSLCGAGVALKLCQTLLGMPGAEKRLDLAALATVADVVPLTGENRAIVREGMLRMADSPRPGLRALMACAGVKAPVRSEDLAFRLAPRLNAAGRLEEAGQAVRLLITQDPAEAQAIAAHLEENNRRRQAEQQVILKEALAQAEGPAHLRDTRLVMAAGAGWNSGLIGLAAGKLCERYHYPAVVLSIQGDTAVGSCRSVPGVHIYDMLRRCEDLLIRYGGHEQAAGLSMAAEKIPELRERLNRVIRENCPESCFMPSEEYDLCVPLRQWTPENLQLLDKLEPTGCGNPAPAFRLAGAAVQEARRVGKDRSHLKLTLYDGDTVMDGIAFSMGEKADAGLMCADVLYTPALNEYAGRVSVQMQVRALCPVCGKTQLPGEDALRRLYGLLRSSLPEKGAAEDRLSGYESPEDIARDAGLTPRQVLTALRIFAELKLAGWRTDPFRLTLPAWKEKHPLTESTLYRSLKEP